MPLHVKPLGGNLPKLPPPNPKYKNVKPHVNSGFNEIKAKKLIDETKVNTRFVRDENFRRIKVSQLLRLLDQGQLDILMLDLRDEDEYQQFHIAGAMSYPVRLLSRAMNPFTPEILDYRNREPQQRIILLYDLEEKIAAAAANLFFEKGVDNIFILSGGLKQVVLKARQLLEGPAQPAAARSRSPSASVASAATQSVRTGGGYVPAYAPSFAGSAAPSAYWR